MRRKAFFRKARMFEGGSGSGNWGHKGRPGKEGGSVTDKSGNAGRSTNTSSVSVSAGTPPAAKLSYGSPVYGPGGKPGSIVKVDGDMSSGKVHFTTGGRYKIVDAANFNVTPNGLVWNGSDGSQYEHADKTIKRQLQVATTRRERKQEDQEKSARRKMEDTVRAASRKMRDSAISGDARGYLKAKLDADYAKVRFKKHKDIIDQPYTDEAGKGVRE